EAQARRQEAVANQVRRETEWLGRKESAQRSKSAFRIEDAARRRAELAELKYRNAAAGAAGIDFVATGRQTRKLLTATGIAKSLGSGQWAVGAEVGSGKWEVGSQNKANSEVCPLPTAHYPLFSGLDLM